MERGKKRGSGADDGGSHERVIAAEATGNAGGAEAEEAEARGAGGAKAPLLLLLATLARRRVSCRMRLSKLRIILIVLRSVLKCWFETWFQRCFVAFTKTNIVLRSVLADRNCLRFQKRKPFLFIKNTPKTIQKIYEKRCPKSSRPVLICTFVSFFFLKFLPVPDFF
jgi:hypothetical protein